MLTTQDVVVVLTQISLQLLLEQRRLYYCTVVKIDRIHSEEPKLVSLNKYMNVFTSDYAEQMLSGNNLPNLYIILQFSYNDPKYVKIELPVLIFFFCVQIHK